MKGASKMWGLLAVMAVVLLFVFVVAPGFGWDFAGEIGGGGPFAGPCTLPSAPSHINFS